MQITDRSLEVEAAPTEMLVVVFFFSVVASSIFSCNTSRQLEEEEVRVGGEWVTPAPPDSHCEWMSGPEPRGRPAQLLSIKNKSNKTTDSAASTCNFLLVTHTHASLCECVCVFSSKVNYIRIHFYLFCGVTSPAELPLVGWVSRGAEPSRLTHLLDWRERRSVCRGQTPMNPKLNKWINTNQELQR